MIGRAIYFGGPIDIGDGTVLGPFLVPKVAHELDAFAVVFFAVNVDAKGIVFHEIIGLIEGTLHKLGGCVDEFKEFRGGQDETLLFLGQICKQTKQEKR